MEFPTTSTSVDDNEQHKKEKEIVSEAENNGKENDGNSHNEQSESEKDNKSEAEESDHFDFSKRCVLEDFTRCSESHLWKLMMSFYDREGVDSWVKGTVPYFITCNSFIGRSYAQVLMGFINDCMRPNSVVKLDPSEPLYIIELGTGSGKFSFYMLKALLEMESVCPFPIEQIKYVMTDFTENNLKFWLSQENLRPFFDSKHLDAAIFNAVNDDSLTLRMSGKTLSPGSCKNPICIVANYLFDTLYHDVFQVKDNQLHEGLVSVGSKNEVESDSLDPGIIARFANEWKYNPVSTDYYHSETGDELHFRRMLTWYEDTFRNTDAGASILIPIGALRALRRLVSLSKGKALLLSGDKGNSNPEQFWGLSDPHIAVHGSFSVMVNYHAIGLYCTSKGGFAMHNPQEEASLKVGAFLFAGDDSKWASEEGLWTGEGFNMKDEERSRSFPNLRMAFNTSVVAFGPNDFFVMQKNLMDDGKPCLESVLCLLKLSDWDPDVFYKFRDNILEQLNNSCLKLQNDFCRGVPQIWRNNYSLDPDKDIAFEIGRFYYGVQQYEKALEFYKISNETIGEHHVTYHNIGLCYFDLENYEESKEYFNKALKLKSNYQKAISWAQRAEEELNKALKKKSNDENNEQNIDTPIVKEDSVEQTTN